ncbi:thioesterase family protein [Saccharospirillum impatiens]|uniref:thioesterase family protein n=1 Tax=Saccharospirillum impatiens TaxID=169438 RepID=UPI000409E751|nr:thioesterase family protein [Saccharospirillum impatiens]
MILLETRVDPAWVDYNGHMNDAEYARLFSLAADALMDHIGLDAEGRQRLGHTLYTLETHLCYQREAHQGEALRVGFVLLDQDAKRLHAGFELFNAGGERLATSEQMLMGIDTTTVRPATFPADVAQAIDALPRPSPAHWPDFAGRRVGIRR